MADIDQHFVTMLRVVINDLDETDYTYTNTRLESVIGTASFFVNREMELDYTVDVNGPDITPNPFDSLTDRDATAFINLTIIKSACLIDMGTFRTKAMIAGLEAKCGPSSLQTLKHLDGFKQLIELGPCGAYDTALRDYKLGGGRLCEIILSPFVNDNFEPSMLNYGDTERFIGW